jgi:adenine phosphoribosyltransferase
LFYSVDERIILKLILMQQYQSLIRQFADFPQKGIIFYDINLLLSHGKYLNQATDDLSFAIREMAPFVTKVLAIEARGFIMGSILAQKLNAGFVPVRKKGKLPAYDTLIREEYQLEYGSNCLELDLSLLDYHDKIVIFDDVLATGGTATAIYRMLKQASQEGKLSQDCLHDLSYAFLLKINALYGDNHLQNATGLPKEKMKILINV